MKKNISIPIVIFTLVTLFMVGCKKDLEVALPPLQAHFANSTSGSFYVQNTPDASFKIPVGITAPTDAPVTVTISASSPTGAAAGAQYSLPSTSITIPAGETLDSFTVNGIFAGFAGNRIDTVIFNISGGDAAPSDYNSTYTLVMQQYCNVSINDFSGTFIAQDYLVSTGAPDGGPYTVTITPGTSTGTSGTVTIEGLLGIPNPFTVNLNWSNPANFTTSIAEQNWFMHATYGQAKIRGIGTGVFSSCNTTMGIRFQAFVSAGSFGTWYTTLTK